MAAYIGIRRAMEKDKEALIKKDHAALVATSLTLAGGLIAYMISIGVQLDERLRRG